MKVCPHDIDRNQPCSLCATSARTHASRDDSEGGQGICMALSKELLGAGPVPTGDDSGRSDARDAGTSGIWLVTLNATDGREFFFPVLASDGRAIELLHAGFELREMDSLEDALMAAESQGGSIQ